MSCWTKFSVLLNHLLVEDEALSLTSQTKHLPWLKSYYISRHSFAHIAHNSGVESSAIKDILGHSNLATTEKYMGSFDNTRTDETLRNVFAKTSEKSKSQEKPEMSKEDLAIELLLGMTPEQIMSIISAINK